jgi:hypothetical protein
MKHPLSACSQAVEFLLQRLDPALRFGKSLGQGPTTTALSDEFEEVSKTPFLGDEIHSFRWMFSGRSERNAATAASTFARTGQLLLRRQGGRERRRRCSSRKAPV